MNHETAIQFAKKISQASGVTKKSLNTFVRTPSACGYIYQKSCIKALALTFFSFKQSSLKVFFNALMLHFYISLHLISIIYRKKWIKLTPKCGIVRLLLFCPKRFSIKPRFSVMKIAFKSRFYLRPKFDLL